VSDGRKIDKNGRCLTPVGNTVNVKEATFSNSIGEPYLQAFWKDPLRDKSYDFVIRILKLWQYLRQGNEQYGVD